MDLDSTIGQHVCDTSRCGCAVVVRHELTVNKQRAMKGRHWVVAMALLLPIQPGAVPFYECQSVRILEPKITVPCSVSGANNHSQLRCCASKHFSISFPSFPSACAEVGCSQALACDVSHISCRTIPHAHRHGYYRRAQRSDAVSLKRHFRSRRRKSVPISERRKHALQGKVCLRATIDHVSTMLLSP
jgi:hypothetical protein